MTSLEEEIRQSLAHFGTDLLDQVLEFGRVRDISTGQEILRSGQYVKVIPIVIEGLVKVFTRYEEKELLLYYIRPRETCIMSFSASLMNEPSRVFAIAEEDTRALLIPSDKVSDWLRKFPDMNNVFFHHFNMRYSDLLDTINHLLYNRLDTRLLEYLRQKSSLTQSNPLKISHRQIANELGTAREVISRVMKKLEHEGVVKQMGNGIKITAW